ncbi:outer membrane protein transport protein [Myxococcota bacterium]|jgi:hypothetical protein|nr:outer membrane protein transport protein [Myxococcota bacterium]
MSRRVAGSLLWISAWALWGLPAAANPMDTFGHTARAIGMGGAMTAASASYEATFYNPAALGMLKGLDFGLGTTLWRTFLQARTWRLDDGTGTLEGQTEERNATLRGLAEVGLASPVPLGRGLDRHLFLGVGVSVPGTTLYGVRARPAEEAWFPFLEDRNRRLVLNLAAAGRWRWLMVGVGISFQPAVKGTVDVDLTDGGARNRTFVNVDASISPNVGVQVEPLEGLTVGLCWRGENRTDIDIPVSAVLSDKIAPVRLRVTALDWFTPHQVAIGVSWKRPRWTLAADLTWSAWHRYRHSSPWVRLYSSVAEGQVTQEQEVPSVGFHDAWTVRVGGEARPHPAVVIRAGFGFVQSPVPAQTGATNLLDGDRFTGSLGLGFDGAGILHPVPITVDLALFGGGLSMPDVAKEEFLPGNPGYPFLGGRAGFVGGSLSARVRF